MALRKEKAPDGVVETATELGFALYENTGRILIKGPLASAIYFGGLCLRGIELGLVLFFVCLFLSIYRPSVMLPFALICAGFIGVCSLPVIFLRYVHVPLTLILRIKSNYKRVEFNSNQNKLLLKLKGKHRKAGKGAKLERFKRQQELAKQGLHSPMSQMLQEQTQGVTQLQGQVPSPEQEREQEQERLHPQSLSSLAAANVAVSDLETGFTTVIDSGASAARIEQASKVQRTKDAEPNDPQPKTKFPSDPLLASLELSGDFSYSNESASTQPATQSALGPKARK